MGRVPAVLVALAMATGAMGASQETNQTTQISNSVSAQQYWFGVSVENISSAVAKQLKLLPEQGVMVTVVFADSPAEKAGIRADDLLIEINGKPLTSQEELARAANLGNAAAVTKGQATKAPASGMPGSEVVYLRAGDKMKATLMPALRPTEMQVSAVNPAQNRANNLGQNAANPAVRQVDQRNMVLSNNYSLQYGPGYQFDSQAQGSSKALRDAVSNGSLVITQDTDENGNVIKTTFRNGGNSYVLEPGNVDKLPANLKPLAQQMLSALQGANNSAPQQANNNNDAGRGVMRQISTESDDRLKRLEQQNEEMRKQFEEVKRLLLEATHQAAPANGGK